MEAKSVKLSVQLTLSVPFLRRIYGKERRQTSYFYDVILVTQSNHEIP